MFRPCIEAGHPGNLTLSRKPVDIDEPDSQHAYMFRIIEHDLPELPDGVAPEGLAAFLRKGLSKDPDDRPQTAAEFLSLLARIRSTSGDGAAAQSSLPPGWSAAVTNVDTTSDAAAPGGNTSPTEVFNRSGTGQGFTGDGLGVGATGQGFTGDGQGTTGDGRVITGAGHETVASTPTPQTGPAVGGDLAASATEDRWGDRS